MRELIERGERAPDFVLPRGPDGARARFYGHVGGSPAAMVFAGDDVATAQAIVRDLDDGDQPCDVHLFVRRDVTDDPMTWLDPDGGVTAAYGVHSDGVTVILLDTNVRVLVSLVVEDPHDAASSLLSVLSTTASSRPSVSAGPVAPVLLVPNAVEPALCDRIVAAWQEADPVATGVETMADGRHTEALDSLRKRRRDLVVTDQDLLTTLTTHVGRRVIPEVSKAFAYTADRFEGFKIGAYDATDAGFFAAHRDNLSPATAHRAFAMSINLCDDFDGGEVCFPEYGSARFSPDPGEALVFSGSLLHEVRPVTRGRRFVLLSFLFRGARRS